MAGTVERLEEALCAWEDMCFLSNAAIQVENARGGVRPLVGPLANFHKARKHLLNLKTLDGFDIDSFAGTRFIAMKPLIAYSAKRGSLGTITGAIASWMVHSRRVFHITAELQTLLAATSLEGIMWKDIKFPFDSFAMSLEIPIQSESGHKFDFLLLGKEPDYDFHGRTILGARLLSTQYNSSNRFPDRKTRMELEEAVKKKIWHRAADIIRKIENAEGRGQRIGAIFFDMKEIADKQVTDSVLEIGITSAGAKKKAEREGWSHFEVFMRLAVGICMYLQTLPPGSSAKSDWEKHERSGRKPDPRAITNEAQVCTVSCTHKLTAEEREATGSDEQMRKRSLYELCAHFRRGHWRRPPGQGHIPDAPRIVWVRPTLVRRDRLAEGQLPGGAEVILGQ